MLVVNRFRAQAEDFRERLESAAAVLASQDGCEEIRAGRNLDEPALWVLTSRWRDVGSYRRALSSCDVKVGAVPVLAEAIDEPSAYEAVEPGETLNEAGARSL